MTNLHLLTLTDPKQLKLLQAAFESPWGTTYGIHKEKGKPVSIEFLLDVEDESLMPLLEAIREK